MPTLAILPYAQGLRRLPDYLQQLDMESNGKSVQINGEAVSYATGPVAWGQAGTNGQHAFYQLLHQGTHAIAQDFILVARTSTAYPELHQQLLANGLAQSQALMQGRLGEELSPTEVMQGNRASNTILLKALSPYALGQLLALYEHKVFVQGILWGINSFDQPGVELGKVLAKRIQSCLEHRTHEDNALLDTSTLALLDKIADFKRG
jgi:glucose-6-phosphate isomerase